MPPLYHITILLSVFYETLVVVATSCGKPSATTQERPSAAIQQTTQASQSSGRVSFTMASESDFTVRLADDGTAIITGYTGRGGNIAIPAKIQGVQVTQIGYGAFGRLNGEEGRANLTGVQLPEGLKVIDRSAFARSGISTVIIPNTVTEIGDSAFYQCGRLESISIPDSVTVFGDSIFHGSGLKSFTFPAGLIASKKIPQYMFYMTNFEKIDIPAGIEAIGKQALSDCKSLTSATLPSTIKSIDESAFNGCSSLTEVIIPESVTSIRFAGGGFSSFLRCNLTLASQAALIQRGHPNYF